MRRPAAVAGAFVLMAMVGGVARAADALPAPTDLRALLERIRDDNRVQREEDARREAEFRAATAERAAMLAAARADLAAVDAEVTALERALGENDARRPELEAALRDRLGTLGELFGVVRQVASDARARLRDSVVSAQLRERDATLAALADSRELPSADDLERLWIMLQEEMTESGRVVRFPATVVGADGAPRETSVVRVGAFNVVADGRYLAWDGDTQQLVELARQPARRHRQTARALEAAGGGVVAFALDPSRGPVLALLTQTPDLGERIAQGRAVGWVIIALGIIGLAVGVGRLVRLTAVGRRVRAQMARDVPDPANPLGRVMAVGAEHGAAGPDALALKLDEAILRETPGLERGNGLVRVLSVTAPLLGLLGTVTGMIQVFQAITLHGTGDPRLMAGGISQALVTTVLGLVVAIPLLLLHSVLASRSQALTEVLEEQAAGIVARLAERHAGRVEGR